MAKFVYETAKKEFDELKKAYLDALKACSEDEETKKLGVTVSSSLETNLNNHFSALKDNQSIEKLDENLDNVINDVNLQNRLLKIAIEKDPNGVNYKLGAAKTAGDNLITGVKKYRKNLEMLNKYRTNIGGDIDSILDMCGKIEEKDLSEDGKMQLDTYKTLLPDITDAKKQVSEFKNLYAPDEKEAIQKQHDDLMKLSDYLEKSLNAIYEFISKFYTGKEKEEKLDNVNSLINEVANYKDEFDDVYDIGAEKEQEVANADNKQEAVNEEVKEQVAPSEENAPVYEDINRISNVDNPVEDINRISDANAPQGNEEHVEAEAGNQNPNGNVVLNEVAEAGDSYLDVAYKEEDVYLRNIKNAEVIYQGHPYAARGILGLVNRGVFVVDGEQQAKVTWNEDRNYHNMSLVDLTSLYEAGEYPDNIDVFAKLLNNVKSTSKNSNEYYDLLKAIDKLDKDIKALQTDEGDYNKNTDNLTNNMRIYADVKKVSKMAERYLNYAENTPVGIFSNKEIRYKKVATVKLLEKFTERIAGNYCKEGLGRFELDFNMCTSNTELKMLAKQEACIVKDRLIEFYKSNKTAPNLLNFMLNKDDATVEALFKNMSAYEKMTDHVENFGKLYDLLYSDDKNFAKFAEKMNSEYEKLMEKAGNKVKDADDNKVKDEQKDVEAQDQRLV